MRYLLAQLFVYLKSFPAAFFPHINIFLSEIPPAIRLIASGEKKTRFQTGVRV